MNWPAIAFMSASAMTALALLKKNNTVVNVNNSSVNNNTNANAVVESKQAVFTSGFRFSRRSKSKLVGVHPDLVKLAYRALALSSVDFGITEGVRSKARQKQLYEQSKNGGKKVTTTMNSRHLTGHAIDVVAYVNGRGTWEWQYYEAIADAFSRASSELGIPFTWGGTWTDPVDGAHFELSWSVYK